MTGGNVTNKKNNSKYYILTLLSIVYLLNITAGIDLIPDNIPIIGNIDEVIAVLIALNSYHKASGTK